MFAVGANVRVKGYPHTGDPFNLFNFNGHTGVIKSRHQVGTSTQNIPIYTYEVLFSDIDIPHIARDTAGRLIRGVRKGDALNYFDEVYLEAV